MSTYVYPGHVSPRDPGPTREAVLRAASDLLESEGQEAVTLRAVGEAAGVSRSAPYRHVADKAALLELLAARTLREMSAAIRTAAASSATAADALRAGGVAYVRYALAHPHHYLLIFGDRPLGKAGPEVEAAADDAMRAVEELTIAAQDAGALGAAPSREIATALWVFLHGLVQLQLTGHLHEPRTLDGETRWAELLDLALSSWTSGHRPD